MREINVASLLSTSWSSLEVGSIIHIDAFGQHMIIVNDAKTAFDMLDKKSAIYSDRPILVMANVLIGWNNALGLTAYGPRFREQRKNLARFMGSHASIEPYLQLVQEHTHRFLIMTLARPRNLSKNIRK